MDASLASDCGASCVGRIILAAAPTASACPDFHGVISTEDGADILFSFHGYNFGVRESAQPHPLQPYEQRAALAALTVAAGDDRYRWVNQVFAVLEADVRPFANPEHWRIRAFECVNEITEEPRSL
jgi:hypothetical protein